MEFTVQKSEELAEHLLHIRMQILMLDHEYLKGIAQKLKDQAGRQRGMAVLLPTYPETGNSLLNMQSKALVKLSEYIDTLKAIDELKRQLAIDLDARDSIAKLFI